MTAGTTRVLSVPSGHRYVAHLSEPEPELERAEHSGPRIVRLPDPPVAGAPPGTWWPSPALRADWVAEHHTEFDLVHAHFGFESRTPSQLGDWVAALRDHERPLVLTVHDLALPHQQDQGPHLARLNVLVPAADAVLTLTPGAAREVAARWGREAVVVPHPHMAPLELIAQSCPEVAKPRTGPCRIGVHLKSLRANVDAVGLLPVLAAVCSEVPGAQLVVHAHAEILDPGFARHDPAVVALLSDLSRRGTAEVHWVAPMDDQQLWDYLRSLDASVLPYRWGTHSGWLEECRDLGITVLAPNVGYWVEQAAVLVYRRDVTGVDAGSLREAVRRVVDRDPLAAAASVTRAERADQRRSIALAHRAVYAAVLSKDREPAT